MAVPVIMPRQGQSVETCIITSWYRKKGDAVKKGDILFSYETDKAAFDFESEEEGILLDVFYSEGDEVPVLTNVAVIGKPGENISSFKNVSATDTTEQNKPAEKVDQLPAKGFSSDTFEEIPGRLRISPRARAMARLLQVDVSGIKGSGPNGRIICADIEEKSKKGKGIKADKVTTAEKISVAVHVSGTLPKNEYDDRKLSNVRKMIAKAMHDSLSMSAQLTHHMSADVRKLLALRTFVKANPEIGNITLNDMICFATIRALEKFPDLNSHFLGDRIRTFGKVHLGLAVDTSRGLLVPVIKNASDLSLKGLSARLKETADICRKGNIAPELLSASAASFTVSNLGNYGVELFTPVINLPQVAILGVNTILYRPADIGNGVFGFIPVIGLSLTYDHRSVDGGPATLFLKEIKEQIENFNENI